MLYLTYNNLNSDDGIGIKKKIFAQIKVFQKEFGRIFYTMYAGQIFYLMSGNSIVEKAVCISVKDCYSKTSEWIKKYGIRRIYIRYDWSNKWFIEFLKEQKNNNMKTVLEIPTYPYDSIISGSLLLQDRYYRKQLKEYVDIVTTYSIEKDVFGIPVITLQNGVDIDDYPMVKKDRIKKDRIVLIAVASMFHWHGYERIIEGLRKYYKKNEKMDIEFRLIGKGPELSKYKMLVEEYQLQDYIKFLGKLEGTALDQQFENADIALGAFGAYKINIKQGASIKQREYCARGIPFVYGYDDIGFSGEESYVLKVPNDNSVVDINEIVEFYNRVHNCREEVMKQMRRDTKEKFTWAVLMKSVIDFYKDK